MAVKQSREIYQDLSNDVERARKNERIISRAIRYFRSRGDEFSARYMELNDLHRIGNKNENADDIQRRLQEYLDRGQVEAHELNNAYDRLVQAVVEAENDLMEFSEIHGDEFDEQSPEFIVIADRIKKAVAALQLFKAKQLGVVEKESD